MSYLFEDNLLKSLDAVIQAAFRRASAKIKLIAAKEEVHKLEAEYSGLNVECSKLQEKLISEIEEEAKRLC